MESSSLLLWWIGEDLKFTTEYEAAHLLYSLATKGKDDCRNNRFASSDCLKHGWHLLFIKYLMCNAFDFFLGNNPRYLFKYKDKIWCWSNKEKLVFDCYIDEANSKLARLIISLV